MDSFEQIYELYLKDVYKYVFSLCRDPDRAEEITQETFFRALKSMDSFRGDCKMFVWLCQIAKHIYFAGLRKEKRRSGQPVEEVLETAPDLSGLSMEQKLLDEGDAMMLHGYLHDLPEPYKEVFMLRVFGELSFRKIAQIFGKTESWARITYHRGKLKIMEEMEKNQEK